MTVTDSTFATFATYDNLVGQGGSRKVYALGDGTVLKVDYNLSDGIGSCASEVAVWEAVKGTDDARLFAPILAHGNGWLVMAEADCDRFTAAEADAWIDATDADMERLDIGDVRPCNVGRIGGQFVVVDYAFSLCDCGWCDKCEAKYDAALSDYYGCQTCTEALEGDCTNVHECECECTACTYCTAEDCDACDLDAAKCDGCGVHAGNRNRGVDAVGYVEVGYADLPRGRVYFCDAHAPKVGPARVELEDAGQGVLWSGRVHGYLLHDAG